MKKLLLIVIALITFVPMTNAQIQKKSSTKKETIISLRMGYMTLIVSDGYYYLTMLTTNQFDDAMILKLGNSKESAMQSLTDLIEIASTIETSECVEIDNGYGRTMRIYKGGMGGISIYADGYAGSANTSKSEFNKMLNALTK